MRSIFVSWVGKADCDSASTLEEPGPLHRILQCEAFDEVHLLSSYPEQQTEKMLALAKSLSGNLELHHVTLQSPIHFGDIYQALNSVLKALAHKYSDAHFTIQLTSGTPAMAAVSILVGKTQYAARFLQVSRENGVQEEQIPFDIAADFLPALGLQQDKNLSQLFAYPAPDTAAFDDIIAQSAVMKALKQQAAILAQRNVPVLLYGETGTGKELFAKAIHNASPRANKPLLVINCGAIPQDLIDATLFGHVKGAFTGATKDTHGYFGDADGGTLFLDEFGELPQASQVRLLRVLQDGTFTPVGSTTPRTTNVRIVAATNKNLIEEVAAGRFREDLFYRVAIGVLHLPPLRERVGDIPLMASKLLDGIQQETTGNADFKHKKISAKAKKLIQQYPWPGNVRELHATLLRATLWHAGETISDDDIRHAFIEMAPNQTGILNRDISQGIDINRIISEVCAHYIGRALTESNASKSKAAELLGLKNYQTLNNWMEKYGIDSP